MRRPIRIAALVLIAVAVSFGGPAATIAADPAAGGVPALLPDGPVVLPNGRALPVAPAGVFGPSEMAAEWASHANDAIDFTPGARPMPRQAATTLTSPVPGLSGATSLLPLAPIAPATGQTVATAALPNGLKKEVFGFLPYWMLDATDLQWMRYDDLSTIAYFGVAARSDGSLATSGSRWSGWNSSAMTGVINAAHARGDRVVLTITMMAWDSSSAAAQATLLGNSEYRALLVSNIVATVRARNADGVNLDFEPVGTSLRAQYTSFVKQLKAGLVAAGVGLLPHRLHDGRRGDLVNRL